MNIAITHWAVFDGWCASRNVDSLELPIDRFCNLVYYWVTRNMKEDDRDGFDRRLSRPVAGTGAQGIREASGAWSRESELAQFSR